MSEATPLDGKKVTGFRKLSDEEIALMNQLKTKSSEFLALLNHVKIDLLPKDPTLSDESEAYRSLALAKTNMQEACMWACRAVARPDSTC